MRSACTPETQRRRNPGVWSKAAVIELQATSVEILCAGLLDFWILKSSQLSRQMRHHSLTVYRRVGAASVVTFPALIKSSRSSLRFYQWRRKAWATWATAYGLAVQGASRLQNLYYALLKRHAYKRE
ncbi:hypothetical protein EVAR_4220_1 [Eumeta japonica]|uniref:Uncharacterized protein n=1 Tax=Eumeta variegata TaxID=151549 RepID=A0A4C1TIP9_EUMVA|nr:hypothetical protein EVAR_4220_1 [Eumeta japonica]